METQKEIMLDLETMGISPRSAIVTIAGVSFDLDRLDTVDSLMQVNPKFIATVRLDSSMSAGLEIDPGTIVWWLMQSEEARRALTSDSATTIGTALSAFEYFYKSHDKPLIWGNGAGFDNVCITEAYKKVMHCDPPWGFRTDRDYRTLKDMATRINPKVSHSLSKTDGKLVAHRALDDCIRQILLAQRYWRVICGREIDGDAL